MFFVVFSQKCENLSRMNSQISFFLCISRKLESLYDCMFPKTNDVTFFDGPLRNNDCEQVLLRIFYELNKQYDDALTFLHPAMLSTVSLLQQKARFLVAPSRQLGTVRQVQSLQVLTLLGKLLHSQVGDLVALGQGHIP